jgi:curli biogenesis system outer membrane secretion channel CsgG
MYKKSSLISGLVTSLLLAGCASNALNVSEYQKLPADKIKVEIPDVCRSAYNAAIPRVAVVEFSNNTTFGKAEIASEKSRTTVDKSAVAAVGIGVSPVGIGAVAASKSHSDRKHQSEKTKRSVESKISDSVTSAVESQIVELGGARIYSRSDLGKIMQEQKFQQSGLVNEDHLVELGKLAGVQYLVTGSINNFKQKFVATQEMSQMGDTGNDTLNTLNTIGNLAALANNLVLSGMTVETEINIKVLNVETGEVIFAKDVTGATSIGNVENPTFDQLVGGLKTASKEALKEVDELLSKHFKVRGYIMKIKSKEKARIALLNVGEKVSIKPGQNFWVYDFEETEDPLTGKKSCDMTKLPITVSSSDQITETTTWAKADEKFANMLMVGQLVERQPVSR